MFWMVTALTLATPDTGPKTAALRETRVTVSARILRGAEASERQRSEHRPGRVRKVVEKLPDGRTIDLVVFDFE
jgi:hypothetical protein